MAKDALLAALDEAPGAGAKLDVELAALEATLAADPTSPLAHERLGDFLVVHARRDEAILQFDPATDEALDAVEAAIKVKLPQSYRDFNLHWGGGRLYTQEWRQIRLVGALDIEKELHQRLCDRMQMPFLPLVDLGDGDYLAFDTSKPSAKGELPVVWWYGGHLKKKVSPTFADWLEQLVATGGEAFWWEEA